jgi:hypothetical protein
MIVVGAPVFERAWVLRHWFDSLAAQTVDPKNLHIVLNYGHSSDGTLALIYEESERRRFDAVTVLIDEGADHRSDRQWNERRYVTMVRLRNTLLEYVRKVDPLYYLSCDTDMLLAPDAIEVLIDEHDKACVHGVGPVTHMTPTGTCLNAFGLDGNRIGIPDRFQPVFAVFGVVLMDHVLFSNVDYDLHRQGEDIGFALNAWKGGYSFGITPLTKAKHVMSREMLNVVDERIGF